MSNIIQLLEHYLIFCDVNNSKSNHFHETQDDLCISSFMPTFFSHNYGIEHNFVITKGDVKILEIYIRVNKTENDNVVVNANFQRYVSTNVGYFFDDFEEWSKTEKLSIMSAQVLHSLQSMLVRSEDRIKKTFLDFYEQRVEKKNDAQILKEEKEKYFKENDLALIKYPMGDQIFDGFIFAGGVSLLRYNKDLKIVQKEDVFFKNDEIIWKTKNESKIITLEKAKRLIYSSYYKKDI